MDEFNFKKCNGCPYYYGEVDQCMVGEDGIPDNLEKKCEKEEKRSNKSNYRLAKELGVDPSTIRDARNKKTWRHII